MYVTVFLIFKKIMYHCIVYQKYIVFFSNIFNLKIYRKPVFFVFVLRKMRIEGVLQDKIYL